MLGISQEEVGLAEFNANACRQTTEVSARLQHWQQLSLLQPSVTTAANQLHALSDEFHLTNTAVTQLDIVLQAAPAHLSINHLFHAAKAFDDTVIYITPIHEGLQQDHQFLRPTGVAADRAGFDQGITLPVSALILVVVLQRRKIMHQRTAITIRTQTHVHTKHKALCRYLIQ